MQYTSNAWIEVLQQHGIIISMDGKGRWADNVWIERIWRTIKYECILLVGVESLMELRDELSQYMVYYNTKRLHSSLGYKQPTKYYEISTQKNSGKEYLVYYELGGILASSKEAA